MAALLALLGAVLALLAVFALDWYSVGRGRIAPVTIERLPERAGSTALAQFNPDTTTPGMPGIPPTPTPGAPIAPGFPMMPPGAMHSAPSFGSFGAWESPGTGGTIANIALIAAAVAALAYAILTLAGRRVSAIVIAAAGLVALAAVVYRMAAPPEDISGYVFNAGLEPGIFVALAGALLIDAAGTLGIVGLSNDRAR